MASSDLTFEEIHNYFKEEGNTVKNRDLVHHFKKYLTDPASKDDARSKFKKFVNILAQTKSENGEKFLILRPQYITTSETVAPDDPRLSLGIPVSPITSKFNQPDSPRSRQPPPYRPPPPVSSPTQSLDNISLSSTTSQDIITPQAPPRRRSVDKQKLNDEDATPIKSHEIPENDDKQTVSVKERTQKFNRMASTEDELSPRHQPKSAEKSRNNKGVDEDDGASVTSIEPKKCMEWYVTASKGDLQELVKLAKDEPRLVNKKDPFTTVLHWGAKHGNPEIIKVFAGRYKVDVNGKTNGGYTPLHLAAQFGHKDVFKLLVEVYKIKGRKKQSEKDLGFLRIGSLNVRVKKTTEAFSNFLGVGGASINPVDTESEKVHKGWGSADNVNQDNLKGNFPKRKPKRIHESGLNSTPSTPKQSNKIIDPNFVVNDSDSDSAAGFDSQWKN